MKRRFPAAAMWMAALVAAAVAGGARFCATAFAETCIYDAVPLDGEWEMSYLPEPRASDECPSARGVPVRRAVPGNWEDMVPSFREAGMAEEFRPNPHYRKLTLPTGGAYDFTIPGIYGCFVYRRRVRLDGGTGGAFFAFDCVRNKIKVWVNGKFAGAHEGYSAPFELPVPDGFLRAGENEIVFSVSNDPCIGWDGRETSGLATRALFACTGGIEGRAELRFAKSALSDVYVTTAPDLKTFTVHAGGGEPFLWEIRDAGAVVASGSADGDFTLPADGLAPWSPENPALHELVVRAGGGVFRRKFGIRRLVADGERFRLNGRFVYLRGVTEHCYFPETVHFPRDREYYRSVAAKRKELEFNFVRFHTYVPPEEYLDALDEAGFIVHIESPNFAAPGEYREIVRFARRHPCVAIYCAGNETMIDDSAEARLRAIADVVHGGTDALFTPMSAMRGVEYMLGGEGVAERPFRHNPGRMARLAEFCDFFTSYQLGATSYHSLDGAKAPKVDAWGDAYLGKPRVSHEICIDGCFPDLSAEKLYPPDSPILAAGLFSEIRRCLDERGLSGRAEIYARNSSEWMRRVRKFTFEKVRSMERTVGFDFLGEIDTHWHTSGYFVGMMDEFRRLKPGESVRNFLRCNSAAVLLTDLDGCFNVAAGSVKRVAVSLSNFAADADGAALYLSLVRDSDGEVVWRGGCGGVRAPAGGVAPLGSFDVPFPAADAPRKYLLRAELAGCAAAAENEWELYAFPAAGGAAPCASGAARAIVVEDMSKEELMAAMARGERVLLLGKGPFKALNTSFRIGLAGRSGGNYATVVKKDHPAVAGMADEGFCGWQFRRLMDGGAAVQLEAGVPFDPIVEIASSEKFPIRQAALFEYRVGEGRLLVCSFRFRPDDPAAAWLKRRLEEYAASDDFRPTCALAPERLLAVIDAPLLEPAKDPNRAVNPNDPASRPAPRGALRR